MSATPEEIIKWQPATDEEINFLDEKIWELSSAPEVTKLYPDVGLKSKQNADGSVDRFEARAIADGNFQVYEKD